LFRFSPEEIVALRGVYFSPNGKLASDIFYHSNLFLAKKFLSKPHIKLWYMFAYFLEKNFENKKGS